MVSKILVTAVPSQSPDQLLNAYPVAGRASSVTMVPPTNRPSHVLPHAIAPGEPVTVPRPDFVIYKRAANASRGIATARMVAIPARLVRKRVINLHIFTKILSQQFAGLGGGTKFLISAE